MPRKFALLFASVATLAASLVFAAPKPLFESKVINVSTPNHAIDVDVDLKGAKKLFLLVTDGGDGFACDWADWAEPRFAGDKGEQKLTELKWKSAGSGWGKPNINLNCEGQPLKINGKDVAYGIGTHANSLIEYDVPEGYTRFKARGGLDNGGTNQGNASSVTFAVYGEKPDVVVAQASGGNPQGGAAHEPANAVANLDVHEKLDCTLFASEPMLTNPSNIDIDHRGRIWVCEIVNYRGHNGKRPEGDRILIVEDTDGDGKADKEKVFYQDKDFRSPHGICVLGTPDGKNTKAIVSIGDKVLVFTDEDGDDKADKQEVLFSGISGTQHDHGIHSFTFGPDGKLYFNFGNSGGQLKDKDGKEIVDKAGNPINSSRKPYQQGMVFRCDLDGSNVETLGWNFRNNWEVVPDSYGTLWQSDNDDDGNKGVRINFVMEFGNYGYCDEFTGAGWGQNRTNIEKEVPLRHWHLNDPGVVPNLLQTGAGSPTGLTIYEGELLPAEFRGQVIHTDAGPSVCRAYPRTNDGAGYKAEMVNILQGARNNWFRPDDVATAPDGSLIVADWYDPGVGGHGAGDLTRGRLFRVTPKGAAEKYTVPKFDFGTAAGCVEALKSPAYSVRSIAWTALHKMGAQAEPEINKLIAGDNPIYRARGLWVLGKIEGKGAAAVEKAIADADPNVKIVGLRLARQLDDVDEIAIVEKLAQDKSPQVRRECAIALRGSKSPKAAQLWAELANQHDGKDRWYLEALGIGADNQWDAFLDAYLEKAGGADAAVKSAAARDIIWRSRAKKSPALLATIIKAEETKEDEKPRYFRAFDFLKGPEKDEALKGLLGL